MNDRRAIYLNHLSQPPRCNLMVISKRPKAGVIDQQLDFDIFRLREVIDLVRSIGLDQVGAKHLHSHSIFRR